VANIVIVSTLDTKAEETSFLKELIEQRGHNAILVDAGMGGEPAIPADISAEEVAKAGGGDIKEMRASQ